MTLIVGLLGLALCHRTIFKHTTVHLRISKSPQGPTPLGWFLPLAITLVQILPTTVYKPLGRLMCLNMVPPLTGHIPRVTFKSVMHGGHTFRLLQCVYYSCLPRRLGTYSCDSQWIMQNNPLLFLVYTIFEHTLPRLSLATTPPLRILHHLLACSLSCSGP